MEICFFQILRSLHVNSTSPCFRFGFFFFKRAPHHSLLSPSLSPLRVTCQPYCLMSPSFLPPVPAAPPPILGEEGEGERTTRASWGSTLLMIISGIDHCIYL